MSKNKEKKEQFGSISSLASCFSKTQKQKIDYAGTKNWTQHKDFIDICKMCQKKLKQFLVGQMLACGYDVIAEDGFLYGEGDIPILLTAHMDTVHDEPVKDWYETEKGRISSPQGIGGDDRCGIWIILQILKAGYKPHVLFCEDEETGGIGSHKFVKTNYKFALSNCKYFIELDRMGNNDAVFYKCGNKKFQDYIMDTTKYQKAYGSFSDISVLSPETDIASVNLSCGYYNPHTLSEYVEYDEMERTTKVVQELLDKAFDEEAEWFDYQQSVTTYGGYGSYGYGGYGYRDYYDDDDDYYSWFYERYCGNNDHEYGVFTASKTQKDVIELEDTEPEKETTVSTVNSTIRPKDKNMMIIFYMGDGSELVGYGRSFEECVGDMLVHNMVYTWADVCDYDTYED